MSRLILSESATPPTPSAAKGAFYLDNTANPMAKFVDDGGNVVTLMDSRNTVAQIGGKDFADGTFTVSNVSSVSKAVKFALSGMTAAVVLTLSSSQSTSQTLTIPNIAGADTLMTLGLAQTVTGALTCSGLNAVLMSSSGLTIRNPGNTFSYTIVAAAIAAARNLNLPLTTGTDTLMTLGLAQTVSGALTLSALLTVNVNGAAISLTGAAGTLLASGASSGIGYATGAGGAVTQATSKVTAFTLSRPSGTITFAADALAADTSSAGATWTNTVMAANDNVVFTHTSGGTIGAYSIACTCGAGSGTIFIRNNTPGSLSEAPVFKFTLIKGAIA